MESEVLFAHYIKMTAPLDMIEKSFGGMCQMWPTYDNIDNSACRKEPKFGSVNVGGRTELEFYRL